MSAEAAGAPGVAVAVAEVTVVVGGAPGVPVALGVLAAPGAPVATGVPVAVTAVEAGVSAVRPGVLVAAAAGLEAVAAGWPGVLSVAVPDLRQTTTSANTAARSPIAMNTRAMPPLTVTPSAHQVPSPGTASAIPGKYALARGVLHAGACGRYYGSLALAAGCGQDAGGRVAGGGRPSLASTAGRGRAACEVVLWSSAQRGVTPRCRQVKRR